MLLRLITRLVLLLVLGVLAPGVVDARIQTRVWPPAASAEKLASWGGHPEAAVWRQAATMQAAETQQAASSLGYDFASGRLLAAERGPFRRLGDASTSPWLADKRVGVVSHLEEFRGGGSWVMTRKQYGWFVEGKSMVGDSSGQYLTTRAHMDKVFAAAGGDLAKIEKALGFDRGHFADGGGLVRIDVHNPLLHNAKMPTGFERGANPHFRAGGYTSGGAPEAVIRPVPSAGVSINFFEF